VHVPSHPLWFWLTSFAPLVVLVILWAAANTLRVSLKPLVPWLWAGFVVFTVPYLLFDVTGSHRVLRLAFGSASYSCWGMALWIQGYYFYERLRGPDDKWYLPWTAAKFSIPSSTRIFVRDIDSASPWYIQNLGLRKLAQKDIRDSEAATLAFKEDGRSVVLTTRAGAGTGNRLILFTKKIGKMREIMTARGVMVGKVERDRQGTQYFQIHDPEGNEIEVVQEP
jgi:predicted enzyme related to lactoylglutathione lyase